MVVKIVKNAIFVKKVNFYNRRFLVVNRDELIELYNLQLPIAF